MAKFGRTNLSLLEQISRVVKFCRISDNAEKYNKPNIKGSCDFEHP